MSSDVSGYRLAPLAFLPATIGQRRVVRYTALFLAAGVGVAAPFVNLPLAQWPAAVISIDTIILVNDIITSALLFGQYVIIPSSALLVLAGGYLFTGLIVVPHGLTFPGAFAPTGLLGAGLQGAALIYAFWHIGSPVSILAYAVLKEPDDVTHTAKLSSVALKICSCIVIVIAVVLGLTWISIAGEQYLPIVFFDTTHFKSTATVIGGIIIAFAAIAFAALWVRRRSVLDYWLMLVLFALISEQILTSLFITARFSLGFYTGRAFSILTSLIVLLLLLEESQNLYARLARNQIALERERETSLMNVEATAAAIAHELNQPLAAITLNAQASLKFLEHSPPDLAEAKEALNGIIGDGHRASEALGGIRALFIRVIERPQPVNMNEIAMDVLHALKGKLKDHGVLVQTELTSAMPLINGNRGQLRQVFSNLINNAIEAMAGAADGSRVLRLITRRQGSNTVIVAMGDTGPGIAPSQLERIFDAFVTTKSQGTGLGLAICRVIVERHGGRLTAHSNGKNGALIQMAFPIKRSDEAANT